MTFFLAYAGFDILKAYALIAPNMALDRYYYGGIMSSVWVPSFSEVLLYLGAAYILVAIIFLLGYVYFERRLGI
jgi:hypothetical protein